MYVCRCVHMCVRARVYAWCVFASEVNLMSSFILLHLVLRQGVSLNLRSPFGKFG